MLSAMAKKKTTKPLLHDGGDGGVHQFLLASEGRLLLKAEGPLGTLRVRANAEGVAMAEQGLEALAELAKLWLFEIALDHAVAWDVAGVRVETVGTEIRVMREGEEA